MLTEAWEAWEDWFVELSETHTSFPVLIFFRSLKTDQSWITAAGAILDAAALALAAIDDDISSHAQFCLDSGVTALRRIAAQHAIPCEDVPFGTPIAVERHEMVAACSTMTTAGIRVVTDLDTVYERFSKYRLSYERLVLTLCDYTYAPYAPWSSDRVIGPHHRPPIFRFGT